MAEKAVNGNFQISCPVCLRRRIVSYYTKWDIENGRQSSKCRSCSRTPEHKEKLRQMLLGNKRTLGFKHTAETKAVIASFSRRPRPDISGANSNLWRGGVTSANRKARRTREYSKWRNDVLVRDNFTCQACGIQNVPFHVDHELPFSEFPQLRNEVLNGRVLCVPCHRLTPTYKNNTKVYS